MLDIENTFMYICFGVLEFGAAWFKYKGISRGIIHVEKLLEKLSKRIVSIVTCYDHAISIHIAQHIIQM